MVKKSIISLLSLALIVSHTGQTFAVTKKRTNKLSVAPNKKPKLSPAAQAFFKPGNHDDAKLHILGYCLNHRNFKSIVEKKGKFYNVLKNFVNLKDKTLKNVLEKLRSPLKYDGRLDTKKARIALVKTIIKYGNKTLLALFLPEIFDAPPTGFIKKWYHKLKQIFKKQKNKIKKSCLFPDNLTSLEAKRLLKEYSFLDLDKEKTLLWQATSIRQLKDVLTIFPFLL